MKNRVFPEMYFFEKDRAQNSHILKNNFRSFKPHSHDFYEFEYFLEGCGVCEINGKEYPFQKGDISFATPLDIHGYKGDSDVRTLTVHFRPASMNRNFLGITNVDACVIKSTKEIRSVFEILDSQDSTDEFYGEICEKLVETIWLLFLQIIKTSVKDGLPKEIYSAIDYINLNFKNDINLKSISEYVGYSQEHFCRIFKKYTGVSFLSYLTELRVTYAKHLLDNRGITVTQACYECGFGCLRSFHRAFKKKYGFSPRMNKNQKMS